MSELTLATYEGSSNVPVATTRGQWAVHKSLDSKGCWCVTHAASGLLAATLGTKRIAVAVAAALEPMMLTKRSTTEIPKFVRARSLMQTALPLSKKARAELEAIRSALNDAGVVVAKGAS